MKESNGTFDISVQVSTTTLAPILSTSELGPWLCSYLSQTKWKVKQNNSRNHQCLPCSGVHPLSLSKLIHQNKLTSSSDRKMQSSSVRKTATTLSSLEETAEWIIRIHAQLKLLSHGLRTQAKHVVCPCYHLCLFVFICEWKHTRIMTASVSAINFQELNLVAYTPVVTLGASQGATAEQMPGNCMPKG